MSAESQVSGCRIIKHQSFQVSSWLCSCRSRRRKQNCPCSFDIYLKSLCFDLPTIIFAVVLPAGGLGCRPEKARLVLSWFLLPVLSSGTGPSSYKRVSESQLFGEVHYGRDLSRLQSSSCAAQPRSSTREGIFVVNSFRIIWYSFWWILAENRSGTTFSCLCHCDQLDCLLWPQVSALSCSIEPVFILLFSFFFGLELY